MERHKVKCHTCGNLFWIDILPDIKIEWTPDGKAFVWYCPQCVNFRDVEFFDIETPPSSPSKSQPHSTRLGVYLFHSGVLTNT